MDNIFIHIGLRKTATTWLQDTLFSNISDINYIAKSYDNYPQWLIQWHYLDDYAFEKNYEYIKKKFYDEIDSNKVNVLSSEAFSNTSVIYSQANRIKKIVPNAKIIITLRDPIDVIKSHYKLDLQDGIHFLELDKYLDWDRTPYDLFKRKPIYLPDFFYDENIDYYNSLFGDKNVLVLKFEDMRKNPEDYFSSLAKFLNIEFDYKIFDIEKKLNVSNSLNLSDVKYSNFKNYLKENIGFNEYKSSLHKDEFIFTDTIMSDDLKKRLKNYFKGKCFGYY